LKNEYTMLSVTSDPFLENPWTPDEIEKLDAAIDYIRLCQLECTVNENHDENGVLRVGVGHVMSIDNREINRIVWTKGNPVFKFYYDDELVIECDYTYFKEHAYINDRMV